MAWSAGGITGAGGAGEAHPHQGILIPYRTPPALVLDEAQRAALAAGETVFMEFAANGARHRAAVFRVDADAEVVWSVIADFDAYPEWIDSVIETEVYRRAGPHIFVRFIINGPIFTRFTYYVHHVYPMPPGGWGAWTLDYSRRSDFNDTIGFWRIDPLKPEAGRCDVTYSADLLLAGWWPEFLAEGAVDEGLKEATRWVKREAEARMRGLAPDHPL